MKSTLFDMELNSSSEEEVGTCSNEGSSGGDGGSDVKSSLGKQEFNMPLPDDDTVRRMVFNSWEEAEKFYIEYGRNLGFDVRRSHSKVKKGVTKNRIWECARAGLRKRLKPEHELLRKPKPDLRCECPAKFRVVHGYHDGLYRVTTFHSSHNHQLETAETSHRLKCNRFISPSEKALLSGFRDVGIRTCQGIDFLEHVKGGPGKLSFQKKDAYNFLNKQRICTLRNGDINTALSLLEGMKICDPDLIIKNTVDDDQSLSRLFWTDGFSRAAYDKFGDILVLDSTYKTNTYKFPLIILSGIDNHLSNIIFGAALMCNETIESYVWLFKRFLAAMGEKAPPSVVTDQDDAMRAAIKSVFPQARHRLCGWHLERNCNQNVKAPNFCSAFGMLMRKECSTDEFEREWVTTTENHDVADNAWIKNTYSIREMWSEAYFRGHFMAMTRTTQRAESLNYAFKQHGKAGSTITELLKHYHHVLGKMRANFYQKQEDFELSIPTIKCSRPLFSLENHAATMYTKPVFDIVRDEIEKEQGFFVVNKNVHEDRIFSYILAQFGADVDKQWSVKIDLGEGTFVCDCQMLESDGLPCRHLFTAFKHMDIQTIPSQCVRKRWTIQTGQQLHGRFPNLLARVDPQRQRFMKIYTECGDLCLKASQTESATTKSLKRVRLATKEIEDEVFDDSKSGIEEKECGTNNELCDPVRCSQSSARLHDPQKVRSRGAPRAKKQKCGACGISGHKSSTCTTKLKKGDECATQGRTDSSVDRKKIDSDVEIGINDNVSEEL